MPPGPARLFPHPPTGMSCSPGRPGAALGRWEPGAHPPIHTASRAAADARGRAGHQSAAASNLSGLSLQEAQQILNVSKLSPEEIQKVRPPGRLGDKPTTVGRGWQAASWWGREGGRSGALAAAGWDSRPASFVAVRAAEAEAWPCLTGACPLLCPLAAPRVAAR